MQLTLVVVCRECQVGHWKQHKKTCKKSKDKREPERETLQPGMFRMNKSIHGGNNRYPNKVKNQQFYTEQER